MKTILAAAAAAVLLAGPADAATVLAKPGATYEIRAADLKRCHDAAQDALVSEVAPEHPHPAGVVVVSDAAAYAAIGVIGIVIAEEGLADADLQEGRAQAEQRCIRYLGYVQLPLTTEEAAEYDHLSSSDRAAWEKTFLARDLSARLAPLTTPKVPPLPDYRAEKATHGGLKIDTASLAIAAAQVTGQGDIVAGKAARWRTAILKTPIEAGDNNVHVSIDAGTVFHQVDYRTQYEKLLRNPGATWCGPAMEAAGGNTAKSVYCFTTGTEGYDVYRPTGQGWFAGPHRGGFTLPAYTRPIVLEERATDDLGAIDFAIAVTAVKKRVVQLTTYLRREGKQVEVWNRALVFNSRGQAVVPLWDRRLWLTRLDGDTIKADLANDGDGTGWRETD